MRRIRPVAHESAQRRIRAVGGSSEPEGAAGEADVAAGENPVESPAVEEAAPIGAEIRERTRRAAREDDDADDAAAPVTEHEPVPGSGQPGEEANADAHAQGRLAALEPYVKQLAAGEGEAVEGRMASDAELRAALIALAADPVLAAAALDHARIRGSRRELAERQLARIGEDRPAGDEGSNGDEG